MKILWVNPEFLDYRVPVYDALNKLCNNELYVVYSGLATPQRVIEKMNAALKENSIPLYNDFQLIIGSTKSNLANSYVSFRYPKKLMKTIKRIKPDIIICEGFFKWSPYAMLQAKCMRIPLFVVYERTEHTERNCPKWRECGRKLWSPFIKGFFINGKLTHEYLKQIGYGKKMIYKTGMAADSYILKEKKDLFTNEERLILKEQIKVNKGITYLFVGQMVPRKGIQYLLAAWKNHTHNFPLDNLLLIGDGNLLNNFKKEYSHINSIKFLGNINYDEIYKYYAIANVFIIPTLEDNWSLVVAEAMACGLPVACSIYNGCYPELVIEGRNGKLFDPLKEKTIIETLSYFHTVNLEEMGKNSIKIESHYNPDTIAINIYNACNEININTLKDERN